MALHIVNHPLVQHKLGLIRSHGISTKDFRELANELGNLLTYEATKDLELENVIIQSWSNQPLSVPRLKGKKITIVPVLRAGIGMMDGVLQLIPSAKVSVVGVYRNEETLQPVAYFEKLTNNLGARMALVLDPMLATGGSMVATLDMLKKRGCQKIRVLVLVAAPEGIQRVLDAHPDVDIFTASQDEKLNAAGYILPGLGDAGDKIFGTR